MSNVRWFNIKSTFANGSSAVTTQDTKKLRPRHIPQWISALITSYSSHQHHLFRATSPSIPSERRRSHRTPNDTSYPSQQHRPIGHTKRNVLQPPNHFYQHRHHVGGVVENNVFFMNPHQSRPPRRLRRRWHNDTFSKMPRHDGVTRFIHISRGEQMQNITTDVEHPRSQHFLFAGVQRRSSSGLVVDCLQICRRLNGVIGSVRKRPELLPGIVRISTSSDMLWPVNLWTLWKSLNG